MKVFSEFQLEKGMITLLSKIVCGRVTLFQIEKYRLVYWMNVRERHKYTPITPTALKTNQQWGEMI